MRPLELEQWVLRVADQVAQSDHAEDALVELKASWPEPVEAARWIAAHANAARGAGILWIIGIDEEKGVCGATPTELSNWIAGVWKHFDDVTPELMDLNVRIGDKTIVALHFRTDRAPYVVRNPSFGKPNGGSVKWEIPWREGRSTRTAKRQDLLRLLAPLAPLPEIECLSLTVRVVEEWTESATQIHKWYLEGSLYVAPNAGVTVTFPTHRVVAQAGTSNGSSLFEFGNFTFYVHDNGPQNPIGANRAGMTATNPGLVFFSAAHSTPPVNDAYPEQLVCHLKLPTVGGLVPCRIEARLLPQERRNQEVASWSLASDA